MSKLSPRLQLIFDFLIPGEPVWDFCCDHGYVGLNAYKSGQFPEIHFVDQVPAIIKALEERFQAQHHDEDSAVKVFFRAQAGEDVLEPLKGSIVIAGVGAHTILKIIRTQKDRGQLNAKRLILCPQNDEKRLLTGLHEINKLGFILCNERYAMEERGRTRKLLIFDKN